MGAKTQVTVIFSDIFNNAHVPKKNEELRLYTLCIVSEKL